MVHVTTKIERARPEDVEALSRFSVATIHEAQGRIGAVSSKIRPLDRSMSFCGSAFTVKCAPRDNIMLQVAISYAMPGDVIVVSAGEYAEAGFFGDVLANACVAKGITALVIDSGVRDTREIIELGFPVFSLSVCVAGTVKESLGRINEPIVLGGQLVRPGDIIRGDADGVVIVRREDAAEVARKSKEREDAEAGYIAAYKAGKSVIEVSNLAGILAAKGLTTDE
ncbi:4-carboxy-4-hydroxy-2-oxoadipate aldolase/oxaloacetate decarboxylase [Chelativorans sp. SCAU2101]|uniref:4-hydroxy-4-methyl-2-oxoglutarate aldolase n=1 Tax=Chelativorans petroleitrophicus TaxID=2975484 RepID=A0A9X3B0W1_9HYPH|nr:4-carboxy-4-hydroxy-2-oxoadipate aldolase/oxaloacetate decarboxylase [Chelativorans petroleitrophicus]MCT8992254.1 4-carboxy-4-hydroxy-2-oxoadipate aldolase/oxaloacetate decarboxylase [Chelativorans petroleitrophicus]